MRQIHIVLTTLVVTILLNVWATVAQSNIQSTNAQNSQAQLNHSQILKLAESATTTPHAITMTLPSTTGTQFAKVSFSFTDPTQENGIAPIRFDLAKTQAFWGNGTMGKAIAVKDAWVDETGVLWIEFNQPVSPKTTLTVILQTQKTSPSTSFQYGIAAYPVNRAAPIFVGDGKL